MRKKLMIMGDSYSTYEGYIPNEYARIVFVANSDIKTEIIDGIRLAGEYFNVEVIALQNIEKDLGHPTIKGMQQIYEQVLRGIVKR